MNSLKEEVKYYIKKHGFLMKDIADELGISRENLTGKLKRETIRYTDIRKIADILGYDIVWKKRKK